ncbi:MAG: YihA family ribosome biogenesis GTP-binding protein [Rhodospirillales bacterium]|nr:YihA family ribosome biogenesis GTP-binding protein [Rhodospirillales bacterium]
MVDHALDAAGLAAAGGAHLSGGPPGGEDGGAAGQDWLEAGRKLFARPCRFVWAAQALAQLPAASLPEIAFAGRSNVGKSSLLNALTGQTALARTSSRPGRTQQLNFFELDGRLLLVDMPGYGYAEAGLQVKQDWQGLMFAYLRGRATLKRVMLLLDARVPLKPVDGAAADLLDQAAVVYQLVLTKIDAVAPAALAAKQAEVAAWARRRPAVHPEVLATSSTTGAGIAGLRAALAPFAIA